MHQNPTYGGLVSRPRRRCPKFNKLSIFKNIAKAVVSRLTHIPFPQGRKWKDIDIITVLAYAWIKGVSIDHSSNKLNKWVINQHTYLYSIFADGRQARAVPHQTTVNAWLRLLSLSDAQDLSRAIFEAALRKFYFTGNRTKKVVLQFDLTYLGYWGKRRDNFIKGSRMVKGTKRIRHYHGALIHGAGASLYVAAQHVAKYQSKIPFMLDTAQWLLQLGFEIDFSVVDREYYRYDVIEGFKKLGIDVITPAKEYQQLRKAKEYYLTSRKKRVQQYTIGQGGRKGRKSKKVRIWVVLLARGNQRLDVIKRDFLQGRKSLSDACDQLFGLITAKAPQYSGSRFPLLIRKIYKMRWQIETAFRDNEIHKSILRSNLDGTRFLCEMGRYFLYNAWQMARVEDPRKDKLTFQIFRDELVDAATAQLNL